MGEGERFQLGTVGALTLSVVSSVSIVICNKALISSLGFNFVSTYNGELNTFEQKAVMGFGILNGISIGLLNLSLGFNSVGFYQDCTRVKLTPYALYIRVKLTPFALRSIQLSLLILLLGVGIATVNDVQLNALGSILSLLAIVTTCVAQIMTNTIQKKFKVSSTQLLYQSCPYQAGTLLISGPFLDQFLTNQNTSPVTYQVLGHLKTCLVLAFGYILLHDPFNWRNILGIMVALVGMIVYSYFCTRESQKKTDEATLPSSQGKEGESDPLLKTGNGNDVVIDTVAQKAPGWERNKDLHA
ncbi:hypothetical protein F8388_016570 [Cannabis sativa]|uniref:Sugar phosphate transporter domain-containing protein n=1 Tax=Cannabis sativa TaxID=3483 RepID=A0A7J6EYE1_CANSA|nr:hypothetical protein F8388_016570 [Cannabis sativa]